MDAFILETLVSTGWRRAGEVYWIRDEADKAARRMLRRSLARQVRILPVQVTLDAVATLPDDSKEGSDGK